MYEYHYEEYMSVISDFVVDILNNALLWLTISYDVLYIANHHLV